MLKLTNIVKNYVTGDTTVSALKGVDLVFRKNEFVSILGHSGCGKTTLLNIIGGLDQYTSGDLFINGISTKRFKDNDWDTYRNHSVGFIFQSYNLIPHQSVLSNVELALTLSGVSKSERRARAKEALEKVGLADQIHKKPNQMSGGQMQRVAIARALVNNPDILLADEPTGALDTETSRQIMEILKEISGDKLVIMVTHNPEIAVDYSSRIIRLVDGQVTDDSNPYIINEEDSTVETTSEIKNKKQKNSSAKLGKKKSMSFVTALSLSLNNLLTKKARTILTSFAGSIGIIGIAMILALSNGIQIYIDQVQEDTLSSYPITIQAKSENMTETILKIMSENSAGNHDLNAVYSSPVLNKMINSITNPKYTENNLEKFKEYIENGDHNLDNLISDISYSYDVDFSVFFKDEEGKIIESDATKLMQETMGMSMDGMNGMSAFMGGGNSMAIYEQLLSDKEGGLISDIIYEQYDLIAGNWPKDYDEVVLVVNSKNEISDFALLALGLTTVEEAKESWQSIGEGGELNTEIKKWSYEDICNMTFKVVPVCNFYSPDPVNGGYKDISTTDSGLSYMYDNGIEIKISGILRPNPDASSAMITGTVGYTKALTDKIIDITNESAIVKAQKENPDTDILTGLPFKPEDYKEPDSNKKAEDFKKYVSGLSTEQKAQLYKEIASTPDPDAVAKEVERQMSGLTRESIEEMMLQSYAEESGMDINTLKNYISELSDEELFGQVRMIMEEKIKEQIAKVTQEQLSAVPSEQLAFMLTSAVSSYTVEQCAKAYDNYMPPTHSDSNYEQTLTTLGVVSKDVPSVINLYASTFTNKDKIAECISDYNKSVDEEDRITYTDYVALLMSSITTIINVISYVLIAFVAISLVVSSIMIGIITYISVLERTKEIGILRAIGASKRDVSRVFNAETLIVGFTAGLIGIGSTLLLCIPANILIRALSGIENIGAQLPVGGAILLVIISMVLTFVAGLIPSRFAAKKDPVEALRSE
ncbi:MAG: ABC transporter ATP-binding protein/permease [Ruminococcaceae bacterium]|nr:ABC transporter ATP-binding protein/permease [Oscillospiraceae bacterium]